MKMKQPIEQMQGLELSPKSKGIARVCVTNDFSKINLSWDRYVRLEASAKAVLLTKANSILDAGGYDGALGFFLPNVLIDLIDPVTTGGSVLQIPAEDRSYDAVVAVDVLEHIEPEDRALAISEFARVARTHIILNYPCQDSKEAQELMLKLTNNHLINEHVEFGLPDSNWVVTELAKHGFRGVITGHTSIAIWLGQYITLNLAPEVAQDLNQHLIKNYANEPATKFLYHLIASERL